MKTWFLHRFFTHVNIATPVTVYRDDRHVRPPWKTVKQLRSTLQIDKNTVL